MGGGHMFFGIKSLFCIVLLSVVSLTGCNSSSSKKRGSLSIDAVDVINSHNKGDYIFSGPCVENGAKNIEYSMASSGSSAGAEPLTGSIDCTGGRWELPLKTLPDGEITFSLSSGKLSASLTLTQDTVIPVLNSVTRIAGGSFTLVCDGAGACDTSYKYRWAVNTDASHTFEDDVPFFATTAASWLEKMTSNGDEDLYLHVQVQDEAGNTFGTVKSSRSFRYDNELPQIVSVRGVSSNSNASYGKESDTITLSVSFSENVSASGIPALDLGNGRSANCTNCSAGAVNMMTFSYQVVSTDNGGLELQGFLFDDGEKITDEWEEWENNAVQPTAPITVDGITLDTTVPSVTNLVVTNSSNIWSWSWDCSEASCEYRHEINTSTSSPVSISGNYSAGATTAPVSSSSDGTYYVHVQATDAAGNESSIVSATKSIPVGGAPTITALRGPVARTYNLGGPLNFQVTFDRSVTVIGMPQLPLQIGATNRNAAYSSGSGSNTLTFRYVTVAGDADSDGVALGQSGAINTNSGQLNALTANVSFPARLQSTIFTGVLVDTSSLEMSITGTHTDPITSSNAAAYPVSGTCQAGLTVEVQVGTVSSTALTCPESATWEVTLNVGGLDKGETTIRATGKNDSGTVTATPVTVTVGDFEQMVITHPRIALGGSRTGQPSGRTCVIKSDGKLSCWGGNSSGQLGNNSTTRSDYPVDVRDNSGSAGTTLNDVIQVISGAKHTCALTKDGRVWCWGEGEAKRLGNNERNGSLRPVLVVGINNSGRLNGVVQISAGDIYNCALGSNGQVSCWGDNSRHQQGHSAVSNASGYPRIVKISQNGPPLEGIVQVACGHQHTCALTSEGKVWCWGSSSGGKLGNGVSGDQFARKTYPVAVRDSSGTAGSTLSDVIQISTGKASSCALKSDGTVYCWGESFLGTSSDNPASNYPLHISRLSSVKAITESPGFGAGASVDIKCALDSDGRPKCWGESYSGQMSGGTVRQTGGVNPLKRVLPGIIRASSSSGNTALEGVVEIRGSSSHICALMLTGKVKCWGTTSSVGIGGSGYTLFPVYVASSSSNPEFIPGIYSSHYVCRKNFSKCVMSPVSLAPGGGESNHVMNGDAPVINVYGLEDEETLSLYSDSACASALSGDSLEGDSNSNPQTLTLSNAVTDQEVSLYYKIDGHDEVNSSLCFKSHITFDRVPPPAPTGVSFTGGASLSSPPDRVNVAVTVNPADSVKEYTVKVYFENSNCDDDADALIAEKLYYRSATLDTRFDSSPAYSWNEINTSPSAPPNQSQKFKFYAKSIDIAGNSSSCTASANIWIQIPADQYRTDRF